LVDWQSHEQDIQRKLDLDSTIASGNKWYDIGDATSNTNRQDDNFPIVLDCKATEKLSYRLVRSYLEEWRKRALLQGKRFLLPVRFVNDGTEYDWCTLHLDDLAELLDLGRRASTQQEERVDEEQKLPDEVDNALFDLFELVRTKVSDPAVRVEMYQLHETIENYCKGIR